MTEPEYNPDDEFSDRDLKRVLKAGVGQGRETIEISREQSDLLKRMQAQTEKLATERLSIERESFALAQRQTLALEEIAKRLAVISKYLTKKKKPGA